MFTLRFETGDAAFDGPDFWPECERVLRAIADDISGHAESGTIRDANGNRIGEWSAGRSHTGE